jgi:hypothetical protein
MKQLNLTFTLFNEDTQGIGDALGMTDDQLAEDFAILMATIQEAQKEGKVNSVKDVIDLLSAYDFFPQFLMFSGLTHFAQTMAECLISMNKKEE